MQKENKEQKKWNEYCKKEIAELSPILENLGFILDEEQPHISGERYLMRAVTTASGTKLILLGKRNKDLKPVVIKIAADPKGFFELRHEIVCREALEKIDFSYNSFTVPKEILFFKRGRFLIFILEYIKQECSFLERSPESQFSFSLKAFKIQEGAQATTYKHKKNIAKTFGKKGVKDYLLMFEKFKLFIQSELPGDNELQELLRKAEESIKKDLSIIDQYSDFLTHTDFVPHNFRIKEGDIYLLDSSSLRFGNKYEGWARFLNFMTLYNRPLEEALIFYIHNNRTKKEYRSLELMRMYRLAEIIYFYVNILKKTEGDLNLLTKHRIEFWKNVLKVTLKGELVSENIVSAYKNIRDKLRSEDEKKRQIGLH
jgi:hypothetical protein